MSEHKTRPPSVAAQVRAIIRERNVWEPKTLVHEIQTRCNVEERAAVYARKSQMKYLRRRETVDRFPLYWTPADPLSYAGWGAFISPLEMTEEEYGRAKAFLDRMSSNIAKTSQMLDDDYARVAATEGVAGA